MVHFVLRRIRHFGNPPLVVIRRALDTGTGAVLDPGTPYPVDWDDKRQVMRARQYIDQRRVAADQNWLLRNVPGAAKRLGIAAQEPKKQEKKNGTHKR